MSPCVHCVACGFRGGPCRDIWASGCYPTRRSFRARSTG